MIIYVKGFGNLEYLAKFEGVKESLKIALNNKAWDGEWFRRAYMDNGKVLGSKDNEECKIDSIAQSWSVISGAGDNDKTKMAIDSLEKYLVNKDVRNY